MLWFEKLVQIKKQSGKTTDEISALSGIPKGTLNKIFAGVTKDPQLETIKSILYSLGYSLKDLDDCCCKFHQQENALPISNQGLEVAKAFDRASYGIQESVCKLLDVSVAEGVLPSEQSAG